MKIYIHGRAKRYLFVVSIVMAAILAAFLYFKSVDNFAADRNGVTNGSEKHKPEDARPSPTPAPPLPTPSPSTPDTSKPVPDKHSDDRICADGEIVASSFTLTTSASVYATAQDAKNKTNPALTYSPGNYFVFKCYDNMVNITRTKGVPGGWIDPSSPYAAPVKPADAPIVVSTLDVMTIDNTLVNWSHEYPTAFVREYNGYWNINPSRLYLTFDCGYDYKNLASTIMDTLKARSVKAVFFVTGQFMSERPDLVRRMVSEGHIVGNHSYEHLNQPQNLTVSTVAVVDDIRAWEIAYRNVAGSDPSTLYFRPPAGAISRRSMALMSQLGYKSLLWGAAYRDWDTASQPSRDEAMALLRRYTSPGDVVLLHGISQTSSDVLGQYIDEHRVKGYIFSLP